jgi:hypothetical protein
VAANIYVYCPTGADGLSRCDLEERLEGFIGDAAEDCGAGSGNIGFNLDYEFAPGEDPQAWAERLKPFLASIGVRPGTFFTVHADGWERGWLGGGWKYSARIAGSLSPIARSSGRMAAGTGKRGHRSLPWPNKRLKAGVAQFHVVQRDHRG